MSCSLSSFSASTTPPPPPTRPSIPVALGPCFFFCPPSSMILSSSPISCFTPSESPPFFLSFIILFSSLILSLYISPPLRPFSHFVFSVSTLTLIISIFSAAFSLKFFPRRPLSIIGGAMTVGVPRRRDAILAYRPRPLSQCTKNAITSDLAPPEPSRQNSRRK